MAYVELNCPKNWTGYAVFAFDKVYWGPGWIDSVNQIIEQRLKKVQSESNILQRKRIGVFQQIPVTEDVS